MATQKGIASTSATNLLASVRWFHLGVDGYTINADGSLNALPSTWEIDAGASVTLRYRTQSSGVTPTVDANKVTLIAYYETGTGTVVRTFASATTVADNTTYTFHGTSNGLAGGSPRCGTLRLYVQAVKDNSTGGLQDYSVNSDASNLAGALRVNMLTSNLSVNAYPAGATFAYGVAGNEIITLTATHTQRYADRNIETFRIDALDVAATQSSGAVQEIGTTTTVQNFTANNTFDDAAKSYGVKFTVTGSSLLLPAEKWTLPKANGANVTQSGTEAVERQSFYDVDPRITLSGITLSQALHNLGEATTIDFNILNARSEQLTRSINYELKNSIGTVRKSGSDAGANYDIDYTLLNSDDASFDFVGVQWTFNINQTDVDSNPSANAYRVSKKLMIGSAVGLNDLAVSTDEEVYNRGESPTVSYYLSYADGRAYANQNVNAQVHDDESPSNSEDSQFVTSTAGALISYSYGISSGDKAEFDLVGSLKHVEVNHNGNTTDDSAAEWGVSDLLQIIGFVDADNTGFNFWTGKSDADLDLNGAPDQTNETDFFVGADVLYIKIKVANVRGEAYDNAVVTAWLLRNAVISQGPFTGAVTQTESGYDAWQDLFYQADVKAPAGGRVVRVEAALNGNTTGNATRGSYLTKNINFAPSYTGNLEMSTLVNIDYATNDVRIQVQPFILATDNTEQKLSEVSPAATLDIDPAITLKKYNPAGPMTVEVAKVTMTQTNAAGPTEDDDWEHTYSALSTGVYAAEISMTINGGQVTETIPVWVGQGVPHHHVDDYDWDLAIGSRD